MKEREFPAVPYALASNQWILFFHRLRPTHAFSPSSCLTAKHPLLNSIRYSVEILNICDTPTCISLKAYMHVHRDCVFLWFGFGEVRCDAGAVLAAPLSARCQPVWLHASFLQAHCPKSNIYLLTNTVKELLPRWQCWAYCTAKGCLHFCNNSNNIFW